MREPFRSDIHAYQGKRNKDLRLAEKVLRAPPWPTPFLPSTNPATHFTSFVFSGIGASVIGGLAVFTSEKKSSRRNDSEYRQAPENLR